MKLDGLIDSGLREVGPRLSLVGLLPNLALFGLIASLLASGAPQAAPDVAKLWAAAKDPGGGEALLLVAALLALALVLHPLQLSLVRLLEGYWGNAPGARDLARLATARQARRRDALVKALGYEGGGQPDAPTRQRMQASAAALMQRYPSADRLMPTALGNVLRAAEDRPQRAYGLDGVVIWPRLFPLLPESMRSLLGDARNQMDVTLRFAAVFFLAALVCGALLWRHPPWLGLALISLVLAWLSYRAGVQAAIAYGNVVEVAFDLYRFSLYPALHLALPNDLDSERKLNAEVSAFLRQRVMPSYAYTHPPPPKAG
ncbi:hypothetical protein SAMN05444679_103232 [Variovorax sp. CF079]|uniref:hypothetical protein n=1 Tax=Variovorax sp. CF079 TaxID=1882774 RepID=UPI0008879233|nr:hypothetical protein [Variovorax sp. CF079]SDC50391.1 hypothetical protein SAMN05444679_103232 [Variovorax sp. CF079]